MLGKLAKKLRLLGFDTEYYSNFEDNILINIARKKNRILITKDVQLVKIASKRKIHVIQINAQDEIEQFRELNKNLDLGELSINANSSRCTLCNGFLNRVASKQISQIVPKRILENNDEFWQCKNCKKVYWEGTHIQNLQRFTEMLNVRT